jgi:hypothetical protein
MHTSLYHYGGTGGSRVVEVLMQAQHMTAVAATAECNTNVVSDALCS